MVALPVETMDPSHGSSTDARTLIPEALGWQSVLQATLYTPATSKWRPLLEGFRASVEVELSNQEAATALPTNDPAFGRLIEAIEKIAEYSDLPNNWDSYGGVGLSQPARERAQSFVLALLSEGLLAIGDEIDILPVPTGGIQFEWTTPRGSVEIEIDQAGHFHSLFEFADGRYEASQRSASVPWSRIREGVERIMG